MSYQLQFFNSKVQASIEAWPIGIIKKTQATPPKELDIARKRLKEINHD